MKARAKTNIKYGSEWYAAGEEMEIREADLIELKEMVIIPETMTDTKPDENSPDTEPKQEAESRKPGRKHRKREE